MEGGDLGMSSVDERVVDMKFNNGQFQKGVSATQKALDGLKKGLNLDGAKKSLAGLSAEGSRFNLSNISKGVEHISSKLTAVGVVGVTALATITASAVAAGAQLVKSLTVAPIAEGFNDYNAKLTSVQTIMNATGKSISVVSDYFSELDTYADKTIYNLSDMTGAFAKFTNAGIDMDKSVPAIKGIANMVALAGQDAGAASIAMYNLSQSLAGGFLTTTDYKSLNLANVATKEWKNQMIEGAIAAGTLKKNAEGMYTIKGGDKAYTDAALFNEALAEGWASADVLVKVLGDYGDTTTDIGKKAQSAAQDVKSAGMMLETLSASVGTGWTDTFELILGNVEQSKALFTPLTNELSGFLDMMSDARNVPLGEWNELGGREVAIEAVKNAYAALLTILTPLKDAAAEIFPPITGQQIFTITQNLRDFAATLALSGESSDKLKRTFKGVFAVLDIVRMVVFGLLGVLGNLFGVVSEGGDGFLDVTSSIGDFLVSVRDAIRDGEGLTNFFKILGTVLAVPIKLLQLIGGYIADAFTNFEAIDLSGIGTAVDKLEARFDPIRNLGKIISAAWEGAMSTLGKVRDFFMPFAQALGDTFGTLGENISESLNTMDFSGILDGINTGLLGGLVLLVGKFLKDGFSVNIGGGFLDSMKGIFENLTGSLEAMQTNLKADTLIKIAGAIALLTASVLVLSLIDSGKLTSALTAMAVMFTQLMVSMAIFEKTAVGPGFAKMPFVAASMILLGIAINILALAVAKLSGFSWEELAKGLGSVAVLMGIMVGVSKTMGKSKGIYTTAASMVVLSVALLLMAEAVEKFAGFSWTELAKGLSGAAGGLVVLAGAMRLMPKSMATQAVSLVIVSSALLILGSALEKLGGLSWEEIARGLTAMAGSLIILAVGLGAMQGSLSGAAGLVVAAAGLLILSDALSQMGGMSWEEIGKGMVVLAGSLILLAAGLYAMAGSLPGAAGLLVAAAALRVLAPALQSFGEMSWEEIGKGLLVLGAALGIMAVGLTLMIAALPGAVALTVATAALALLVPVLQAIGAIPMSQIAIGLGAIAAVFAILGIAGALLTPAIPTLMGLGIAIALLGVGALAAGVGILAFSIGLTALSVAGAAGAAGLTVMVSAILGLIPLAMEQLALGIIAFAAIISESGPVLVAAITTLIMSLLTAIQTVAPQIISTLVGLITALLTAIVTLTPQILSTLSALINALLAFLVSMVPRFVNAGLQMITGILNGIGSNIGGIVEAALNIVTQFINGIAAGIPGLVEAGINLVITFVESLADGIRQNTDRMNSAGRDLAGAIIEGMTSGIMGGIDSVVSAAREMASNALDAAKNFLDINSPSRKFRELGYSTGEGYVQGIDRMGNKVDAASENMGKTAIGSMKKTLKSLASEVESNVDANPTIRPVLDLSAIRKGAAGINGMMGTPRLDLSAPAASAAYAAEEYRANKLAKAESMAPGTVQQNVELKQYNNSPKALSAVEIYRQTKSALSAAKGALENAK
jgi:phage-related protein